MCVLSKYLEALKIHEVHNGAFHLTAAILRNMKI